MFSSRMNGYLKFFLIVVRRLQNTVELSVLQLDIDPPYTNNKFHHIPINHREIWLGGYQASEEEGGKRKEERGRKDEGRMDGGWMMDG